MSRWSAENRRSGTSSGMSGALVCLVTLALWQAKHARQNALTSDDMPRHTKRRRRSRREELPPGWARSWWPQAQNQRARDDGSRRRRSKRDIAKDCEVSWKHTLLDSKARLGGVTRQLLGNPGLLGGDVRDRDQLASGGDIPGDCLLYTSDAADE